MESPNQKTGNNIAEMCPNILESTVNVNGLNLTIKRLRHTHTKRSKIHILD